MEEEAIQIMKRWRSFILKSQETGLPRRIKQGMSLVLYNYELLIDFVERRGIGDKYISAAFQMFSSFAFDADEVLDELLYKVIMPYQCETNTDGNSSNAQDSSSISLSKYSAAFCRKLSHKMKSINRVLRNFLIFLTGYSAEKEFLGATYVCETRSRTSRFTDELKVIVGREDDARNILDMLLLDGSTSSSSASLNHYKEGLVIPILGSAGVGKTTLAELIYKNDLVIQYFEQRAWVKMSDEFDLLKIFRKILECIVTQNNYDDDENSFESLAYKVVENLQGKRYLLVLDDVGSKNVEQLVTLKNLLGLGRAHEGSKILVTTRENKVASVLGGTIPPYILQSLSDDECWSIIKQLAFSPGGAIQTPEMVEIGRYIARKCLRLPSVAYYMGHSMRLDRDESSWLSLRDKGLADIVFQSDEILLNIRSKYDDLPFHLKVCLSYFSMFPVDQKIDRNLLIQLWLAEGFIQLSEETDGMSMEDIGEQYFNDLLDEFCIKKMDESCYIKCFRLDTFIHTLARLVVGISHCATSKATELKDIAEIAETRRLRLVSDEGIMSTSIPDELLGAEKLRTLVGIQGIKSKKIKKIFRNKHLRVLELRNCSIGKLPDLSKLIHLRYLDLSDCRDVIFGQSISSLWYLQTLVLRGCDSLTELPKDIGSLRNLRYLDVSRTRITVVRNDVVALVQLMYLESIHSRGV